MEVTVAKLGGEGVAVVSTVEVQAAVNISINRLNLLIGIILNRAMSSTSSTTFGIHC